MNPAPALVPTPFRRDPESLRTESSCSASSTPPRGGGFHQSTRDYSASSRLLVFPKRRQLAGIEDFPLIERDWLAIPLEGTKSGHDPRLPRQFRNTPRRSTSPRLAPLLRDHLSPRSSPPSESSTSSIDCFAAGGVFRLAERAMGRLGRWIIAGESRSCEPHRRLGRLEGVAICQGKLSRWHAT